MSASGELENIDNIFKKLSIEDQQQVNEYLYGPGVQSIELPEEAKKEAKLADLELAGYVFECEPEQLRAPRVVRVGSFQHKLPLPTTAPILEQRAALFELAKSALYVAYQAKVNIFCFQEAWNMPFGFCTGKKLPWCEFAESAENGPTTTFLQELARQYNMVIVSPIFERDELVVDTLWNTAVVIDNHGCVLGKHRKNHIPVVTNEAAYYRGGNTGHPVFETEFGKIAVNICFGRHHPLNWFMFGMNGAEIVFNPSATIKSNNEPLWGIEIRNAAIANGYFAVGINRIGSEVFPCEDGSGPAKTTHYYGSSYVAAPSGSRTASLSRNRNGVLVTEFDLNLCRQSRDSWGFQMTQRLDLYAASLPNVFKPDFRPQIVKKQHMPN